MFGLPGLPISQGYADDSTSGTTEAGCVGELGVRRVKFYQNQQTLGSMWGLASSWDGTARELIAPGPGRSSAGSSGLQLAVPGAAGAGGPRRRKVGSNCRPGPGSVHKTVPQSKHTQLALCTVTDTLIERLQIHNCDAA
eukprot:gene7936-1150_t